MLKLARRAARLQLFAGLGRLLLPLQHLVWRRPVSRVPAHPRVLLFGWYGTETTGDRAILAECCRLLEDAFGPCRFRLATSSLARTRDTVRLLALDAEVVAPRGPGWLAQFGWADLVVVAGGPVMDDPEMLAWWLRLLAARGMGKPCLLLGTGVHPLRRMLPVGLSLAALSARVALREEGRLPGRVFVDPALYGPIPPRTQGHELHLAVNLRPWPAAFYHGPWASKGPTWETFLSEFLQALNDLTARQVVRKLTFFAMHDDPPDDDRLLYPVIAARLRAPATFVPELLPPARVTELLAGCHAFAGMRFHANLLAALAGTPGVGVDYDSGLGKITWFYRALGGEEAMPLAAVTCTRLVRRLESIAGDWGAAHQGTVAGRDRLRASRPQLVEWLAELR